MWQVEQHKHIFELMVEISVSFRMDLGDYLATKSCKKLTNTSFCSACVSFRKPQAEKYCTYIPEGPPPYIPIIVENGHLQATRVSTHK